MGVAAQVALLQAERERQAAEADALRKERLAREEAARKAKEAAEAARRAALARKRWQDAIRKIMEANRKTNAAAQKWHKLVDARVARQQAESERARAIWAKAIEAVMEKNSSERAFKKFVEQMKEFVLTLPLLDTLRLPLPQLRLLSLNPNRAQPPVKSLPLGVWKSKTTGGSSLSWLAE